MQSVRQQRAQDGAFLLQPEQFPEYESRIDEDGQHLHVEGAVPRDEQFGRQCEDHQRDFEHRQEDAYVEVFHIFEVGAPAEHGFHRQCIERQHQQHVGRGVQRGVVVVGADKPPEQGGVGPGRRGELLAHEGEHDGVEGREHEQDRHRVEIFAAVPQDELRDRNVGVYQDRQPCHHGALAHVDAPQAVRFVADEGRRDAVHQRRPGQPVGRRALSACRTVVVVDFVAAVAAELVFGHIRFVMQLPGTQFPGSVPCRSAVRTTGKKPHWPCTRIRDEPFSSSVGDVGSVIARPGMRRARNNPRPQVLSLILPRPRLRRRGSPSFRCGVRGVRLRTGLRNRRRASPRLRRW